MNASIISFQATHRKLNVKITFTYYAFNENPCPEERIIGIEEFLGRSGIFKAGSAENRKKFLEMSMGDYIRTLSAVPQRCFSDIPQVQRSHPELVRGFIKHTKSAQTPLVRDKPAADVMTPGVDILLQFYFVKCDFRAFVHNI